MTQREKDLHLALGVALVRLGTQEPGDSRAVSDEYVAMAAVHADIVDEKVRSVLAAPLKSPDIDAAKSSRIITVCDRCFRASCWHGEFMCEGAGSAGTVQRTERQLDDLGAEHADHYSAAKVEAVCGTRPI